MDKNQLTSKIRFVAGAVEKFVEHNLIEKEQRDENLKKLALAFEGLKRSSTSSEEKQTSGPQLRVKKLSHFKGELPKYQSAGASGMDVRAQLDDDLTIPAGARALVPTGLSMAIPVGYEIQARPRSGFAIREGMTLLNTPGTIDADYRGEIKIILVNLGDQDVIVKDQDRIAQLCICPVIQPEVLEVEELDDTDRGAGGFGSTGKA